MREYPDLPCKTHRGQTGRAECRSHPAAGAGEALTGLSLEQLITMLQGSPEQAQELAEEAKAIYSENTGDTAADESE